MREISEIRADIARQRQKAADSRHLEMQIAREEYAKRLENELRAALTASIPLDRLESICAAERDQRVVVLPVEPCEFCDDSVCDGNPIFAIHADGYAGDGLYSAAGTPSTLAHHCPKCGKRLIRAEAEAKGGVG